MQTTHDGPANRSAKTLMPDTKAELRRHFRKLRSDHVERSDRAAIPADQAALAALVAPLLAGAGPVASYAPLGAEFDPALATHGIARLMFPRVTPGGLVFHRAALADLTPGCLGIPEPAADAPVDRPRVLLVPLLAATPAGLRLGQGGGYYDRALALLRSMGPVLAIGVAHDCQIADSLPADPWDQWLDFVATPTHLVDCAANR